MGKRPAEIEYELERQRRALTSRLQDLQRRVGGDLEGARDNAAEQAERFARAAAPAGDHPVPLLAGALGAGLALGLATGGTSASAPDDGRRVPQAQPRSEARAEKHTTGGSLLDRARDAGIGFVQGEAASVVQDFWDGFRGNAPEPHRPMGERLTDAAMEAAPKPIRSAWENLSPGRQRRDGSDDAVTASPGRGA
ncbi:MAG: hypothetical protein IT304_03380 [Dehalococcoidia bacterium]|nr:hypothetical protein [Dehalococcoidia bacterium]